MERLSDISCITICSSSKFYDSAKQLAHELQSRGVQVFTPRFDFDEEVRRVGVEDKMELTREFLGKVRSSDAVYVIDQHGYTGRSVCIEVGYASALGKVVILSEPPEEGAVQALTDAVVPVEELPRHLGLTS
jgi:nucleoside 2-deoxyribosyltransferase